MLTTRIANFQMRFQLGGRNTRVQVRQRRQALEVRAPLGLVPLQEFAEQRAVTSTGDHAWFIRKMITLVVTAREDPEAVHDILFGTELLAADFIHRRRRIPGGVGKQRLP